MPISSTTKQILSYLSRLRSAVPSVGSGPHPPREVALLFGAPVLPGLLLCFSSHYILRPTAHYLHVSLSQWGELERGLINHTFHTGLDDFSLASQSIKKIMLGSSLAQWPAGVNGQ